MIDTFRPGPAELTILVLVAIAVGIPMLIRMVSRGVKSESILRAVGVTLLICVGGVMFVRFALTGRPEHTPEPAVAQPTASISVSYDAKVNAVTAEPAESAELEPESAATATDSTPRIPPVSDGSVMWLPLSDEVIAQIVTPEGVEALEKLNASLPPELRKAYAIIPLSPAGPGIATPVVHEALQSAIVREALTSEQVTKAIAGFVRMLVSAPAARAELTNFTKSEAAAAEAGSEAEAEGEAEEYVAPSWIENPGIGRIVVKSRFTNASTTAEEALKPAIVAALKERAASSSRRLFHTDGDWAKRLKVDLSDEALSQFIVATDSRNEVIPTVAGPHVMTQISALVEIPDYAEQQVLADARKMLKHDRATTVYMAIMSLWVAVVLISVLIRVTRNASLLRKLVAIPLVSLIALPCLALSVLTAIAMVQGQTFNYSPDRVSVTCSIHAE